MFRVFLEGLIFLRSWSDVFLLVHQRRQERYYYSPDSNMDRTAHSQPLVSDYSLHDTLFDSHITRLSQTLDHEDNWFTEQRAYSRSVLTGWGLPLGQLPYSHDNEQTLRAVVELIGFRQKDISFRSKVKEDIAAITFEKDKYQNFMEQGQRNLQQCMRKLGRIQNQSSQLKLKGKKSEVAAKRERDEDKKMITMLRTKNEQILHEIKKKEQEVNRIKEQMKKSVGQKSITSAKNSFQMFESLSPLKKESGKAEQAKYAFILQRNEREMSQLVQQNTMLRQKLFQLREELLNFNEWIDQELFGETDPNKYKRNSRFPLNHNLLFKKESLVDQFNELLEIAKDGVKQLRDLHRGGVLSTQKKTRSSELLPSCKNENEYELNFKKKLSKPSFSKTQRNKLVEEKEVKDKKDRKETPNKKNEQLLQGNITPRSNKVKSPRQAPRSTNTFKTFNKYFQAKQWEKGQRRGSAAVQPSELHLPFEDELLSDVVDVVDVVESGQDSSIVSHIQVDKLGKTKFDKWDILYQDDE